MNRLTAFFDNDRAQVTDETTFWRHIANDASLSSCNGFEKFVIGCELIAALDEANLLRAA